MAKDGGDSILELIFKGLLQWLFDMIINICEYLANSLLTIFSMDLNYFEKQLPITSDIVNIMICLGWALMLGNLVFQAIKSMATGLGFEGEDPQMLFTRTFVMSFFLLCSRQICDIGLGIAKKVIALLEIPTVVQVPKLSESIFSVPGDASWLLVIIIGIILVVQIIKLFFEVGERYVIVAILTILSPLAFSMGGSKSTEDIFKGWARMFSSMCIMMVLSVVFLKFILSAMSVVPSGVAVIPWAVFIISLSKANKKIDGLIARIGLNPAATGDPLGHSRMPGMLTYMVAKNMAKSIGKTTENNSTGRSNGLGNAKSASSSSINSQKSTPARPPIGSNSNKDTSTSTSSATDTKGNTSIGTHNLAETNRASSHATSLQSTMETNPSSVDTQSPIKNKGHETRPEIESFSSKGKASTVQSGIKNQSDLSASQTAKDVNNLNTVSSTAANDNKNVRPNTTMETGNGKGLNTTSRTSKPSADVRALGISYKGKTNSMSTQAPKASTPIANKPSADIKTASKAKSSKATHGTSTYGAATHGTPMYGTPKTDISSSTKMGNDKTVSSVPSSTKGNYIVSRGASVKAVNMNSAVPNKSPQALQNSRGEDAKSSQLSSPISQPAIGQSGENVTRGGGLSQNQSNTTNVAMQQKIVSSSSARPEVTTARSGLNKPSAGNVPNNMPKINEQVVSRQTVTDTSKDTSPHFQDSMQPAQNKEIAKQNAVGNPSQSYNNTAYRPENNSLPDGEPTRPIHMTPQTIGSDSTTNVNRTSNVADTVSTTNTIENATSSQTKATTSQSRRSNSSQLENNHKSVSKSAPKKHKQEHNSRDMDNTNKEKLKNRPPYHPSSNEKPGKRKGGRMNERQK